MELTLDQVLQKGIEAQRLVGSGSCQYYTAILVIPNILMLIITWEYWLLVLVRWSALPFFKTAEVNSAIGQYWLSYIDALIRLDRIADAKAVLDQAKVRAQGYNDQTEKGLVRPTANKCSEPSQQQLQSLISP